jgi:hypothetical protein
VGVYRRTNPEPAVLPTAGLSHLKSERMTDDNHSQENVCALTFNLHLRLLESLGEPLLVNQTLIYGVKVQPVEKILLVIKRRTTESNPRGISSGKKLRELWLVTRNSLPRTNRLILKLSSLTNLDLE